MIISDYINTWVDLVINRIKIRFLEIKLRTLEEKLEKKEKKIENTRIERDEFIVETERTVRGLRYTQESLKNGDDE